MDHHAKIGHTQNIVLLPFESPQTSSESFILSLLIHKTVILLLMKPSILCLYNLLANPYLLTLSILFITCKSEAIFNFNIPWSISYCDRPVKKRWV